MTKLTPETSPSVGIIIPAYNPDRGVYETLLRRISTACRGMDYEVLVVDDGSNPSVPWPDVDRLPLRIIRHSRNRGKGDALKTGFRHFLEAKAVDVVITIDADLQHPPEKIPEFLDRFHEAKKNILVGYRPRTPRVMPWHRILSNTLTSLIISLLTGQLVRDSQCGFRLIDTAVLRRINLRESRFHLESELLLRAARMRCTVGTVVIPTIYNKEKSSIKNLRDTLNFVTLIISLIKERFLGCGMPDSENR